MHDTKGAGRATIASKSGLLGGLVAGVSGAAAVALALGLSGATAPNPAGQNGAVRMAAVPTVDVEQALLTIAPDQRDQIRQDVVSCKTALFLMDIRPIPGAKDAPSGFVQLRVGSYLSPRYAVGTGVTSFAVPHPFPDAKTVLNGTVGVIGSARSLRVSFTPAVDFPTLSGAVSQPVYYDMPTACGIDRAKPTG